MGGACATHGMMDSYKILVVKPKGKEATNGDLGADGRIILKLILEKYGM
jgi:hypothetical protein